MDDKTVKEHFTFVHPYYLGKTQLIYFNEDLDLMIEKLTDNRVYLYQKRQKGKGMVSWKLINRYKDFPMRIGSSTCLDVMNPAFSQYIDIDFKNQSFVIKNSKDSSVLMTIPKYLMSFGGKIKKSNGEMVYKDPRYVFNRFQWFGNEMFRITSDDGIEKLIKICPQEKHQFQQIEYRNLQNFSIEYSFDNHIFHNRKPVDTADTLKRLQEKSSKYRAAQVMLNEEFMVHGKDFEQVDQTEISNYFYEQLINLDFFSSVKERRFIVDFSFSYLHWKLMEELLDGRVMAIDIFDEIVQGITYNILPYGDTYLTKLCKEQDDLESFYKRAIDDPKADMDKVLKYKIPIYNNFAGQNCFSLAAENEDLKILNMHLKYLKYYQADHHSRLLMPYLSLCIENELPNLPAYIASRGLQTLQTKQITKGEILGMDSLNTNGTASVQLWEEERSFLKVYKNSAKEVDVQMNFIDIPLVHCLGTEESEEYFGALGETEQLEIFDVEVIQRQIDFNWPPIQRAIEQKVFYPFVAQLLSFWIYEDYFIQYDKGFGWFIKELLKLTNIALSVHFIRLEYHQMISSGLEYLLDFWNYVDQGSPILIILMAVMTWLGFFDNGNLTNTYAFMVGCTQFLLWFKLFYFLRLNPNTGFYIKSIFAIVFDIRFFIVVLFLGFLSFGDALRRIDSFNSSDDSFIDPTIGTDTMLDGLLYIYNQALGGYDPTSGKYASSFALFLILLSTVFNVIIMMNLLIAIISDSFARVNDVSQQASFRERASLISENQFLLSDEVKENYSKPDEYLIYIKKLNEVEYTDDSDKQKEMIREVVEEANAGVEKKIKKIEEMLEKTLKAQEAMLQAQKMGQDGSLSARQSLMIR